MTDHDRVSKGAKAFAVCIVLLLSTIFGSALYALYTSDQDDVRDFTGYVIANPIVDERFEGRPDGLKVSRDRGVEGTCSSGGLICTIHEPGRGMKITKNVAADTISISLDLKGMEIKYGSTAKIEVRFDLGSGSWSKVIIEPSQYSIGIEYSYDIDGKSVTVYSDLFYDNRNSIDVLVGVSDGTITTGINGISDSVTMPEMDSFYPIFNGIKVGAGELSGRGDIVIQQLQIGHGSISIYKDTLHKTIVPDGKDFCFALHIHADKVYPQYFEIMAEAAEEYGMLGTYDAWYYGHRDQYGMDNESYTRSLHELNDAGWDIGIHAGGAMDLTREKIIAAIENITNEYGPIRTWSDHGYRQQDLCINGTVVGSLYYTQDLVEDIGAGWWHDASHSQSDYYDLNIEGMNYTLDGHEDIPLYRVSKGQALEFFYETGREQNVSTWLRAWASERSVFVTHDYFPFFFYVTNETGSYSVMPDHEGIMNAP
ncbi:MAG: hypothetical protein WC375_10230, partial [Methanomassiliicoccales archaeon]